MPLTTSFQSITLGRGRLEVSAIHLVNRSGSPVSVSICEVPASGEPAETNALLWDFAIPAQNFIEFGAGVILGRNATLQAKASADNSVNLKLSHV